jgi:hypothetical protein
MTLRATLSSAVLVCALALAGCGSDADPAPASTDDEGTSEATGSGSGTDQTAPGTADADLPITTIPDNFPLSAGMGGPEDTIPTTRTGTGLRDLTLCDSAPLRGLGVRDRMTADNSGGESADTRELVLLGSPDEAAKVARSFSDLTLSCDAATVRGDTEIATELRETPFGPAPAATLLQTYTFDGEPGSGATIIHVVPVGSALLVTSTFYGWSDDALEQGVAETIEAVRPAVDAMAAFDDGSTSPTEIPEDFPLAVGLPDADGETEVSAPSADGDGMGEVEMCGAVVWPGASGGTRRLVTGAFGPEYFDGRELLVHTDAEVASEAMAPIRQAARDCRAVGNQVWTVLDRDTGYDTVTMGLTYSDGLGSSVFQVTRVGSARVMVSTYGEGSLASLDQQADQVTGTTEKIVPAMCVFTKTGC